MIKLSSRVKAFLLMISVFLTFTFNTTALVSAAGVIPEPSEALYVTDNANVLSTDVINYIIQENNILYKNTGAQIAVLTVDFIPEGYDSETFSYAVFDDWGIGSAERNNGILMLLVPGEGKFWITQGSGLLNALTSGKIDNIINKYLTYDFDAGRYDQAVTNTFNALLDELDSIYGTSTVQPHVTNNANTNSNSVNNSNLNNNSYKKDNGNFFGDIVVPVFIFLMMFLFTLRYTGLIRRNGRPSAGGFGAPYAPRPRPFFIPWWGYRHHRHTPPPPFNHHNQGPRGPAGGSGSGNARTSSFGGGTTRGGGAGRSSTTSTSSRTNSSKGSSTFESGTRNSFGGRSSRSGFGGGSFGGGSRGGFGGGGSRGGGSFGGGSSRGGGAGRK